MAYEIVKIAKDSHVVKQGDKVYMRVFGPQEGEPPQRVGESPPTGPDVVYTKEMAEQAVRYVRSKLPLGAFNNQMLIGGEYKYLTRNIAPRWLAARAETMYASLAFSQGTARDPVTQMAARSLATITVGGGVCSLITYVTAGYLTTIARKGTTIAAVFDGAFDHSYVVLCYGTSPFMVADPWVGTSYVCLWDDCSFPPGHVSVHTRMEIEASLSVPYGVEFAEQEVRTARAAAEIDLIANPPEREMLRPGEQSLTLQKKYQWFHMDHAYAHPDNIMPKWKTKYKSVVGPADWGLAGTSTPLTLTGAPRAVEAHPSRSGVLVPATSFPGKAATTAATGAKTGLGKG